MDVLQLDLDLYIAFGMYLLMVIIMYLFKKFPPKKINSLYGYRTNKSMKNQKTWDFANREYPIQTIKLLHVYLLVCIALHLLFYKSMGLTFLILFNSILLTIITIIPMFFIEKKLKVMDSSGE